MLAGIVEIRFPEISAYGRADENRGSRHAEGSKRFGSGGDVATGVGGVSFKALELQASRRK